MSNNTADFFHRVFHYEPHASLAWIAFSFFGVVAIFTFVQALKYGGRFMFIIPVMAFAESLGYLLRAITILNGGLATYITSTFLILVVPIALALINYMVVSKLLFVTGKSIHVCRLEMTPKRITRIFLWGDMSCFFLQVSASGLLAMNNQTMTSIGRAIVITGLIIQLLFFSTFIWLLRRISTDETLGLSHLRSLSPVFRGLWATIICLLIRNVYRVVEYASAPDGPAYTTEWVFYTFETIIIFIAFLFYALFHFGRLLQSKQPRPEWIMEYENDLRGSGSDSHISNRKESMEYIDGSV